MNAPAYAVPVLEHWLWIAPLHGTAALVNNAAAAALMCDDPAAGSMSDAIAELQMVLEQPSTPPAAPRGALVPTTLGVIPTRACNMHCRYCDFAGASHGALAFPDEMADALVDWAVDTNADAGRAGVHVQFFGGEPFVARHTVERVVTRARRRARERGIHSYIDVSTNGFFNVATCKWIGDTFDGVVMSIDGPPAVHDRNRPLDHDRPSSPVVLRNAKALATARAELCVRMCVSRDTQERVAEHVGWLIDRIGPQVLDIESLTEGRLAQAARLEAPDPYAFAVGVEASFGVAEAKGVRLVYAAVESGTPRISQCPVGREVVIASPDGQLSACYLLQEEWRRAGLDLSLGQIDAHGHVHIDGKAVARVRDMAERKPRCEGCFCASTCAGGCHVHLAHTGRPYPSYCLQTRVITALRLLRGLGATTLCERLQAERDAMRRLAEGELDRVRGVSSAAATCS